MKRRKTNNLKADLEKVKVQKKKELLNENFEKSIKAKNKLKTKDKTRCS